jgi:hypothetical protein
MSEKPAVRIAAGDWWEKNGGRIGIYNANYVGGFVKYRESSKPWTLASQGGTDLNGESFTTHEEATTFVREHLTAEEAKQV